MIIVICVVIGIIIIIIIVIIVVMILKKKRRNDDESEEGVEMDLYEAEIGKGRKGSLKSNKHCMKHQQQLCLKGL